MLRYGLQFYLQTTPYLPSSFISCDGWSEWSENQEIYCQDNIMKMSWELAKVRLVPCLKNTNRNDFINFMYSQELYTTIYTTNIY